MKLNVLKLSHLVRPRTYEGAPAVAVSPELALRRSVLACMLWEDEFYEEVAVAIAGESRELVPKVEAAKVAALAVEARTAMKLRHVPLLLVREMARHATHRALVAETMVRVVQRADGAGRVCRDLLEGCRAPLSGQVKKGLAGAFPNVRRVRVSQVRPGGCACTARFCFSHAIRRRGMRSRRPCGSGWSMAS